MKQLTYISLAAVFMLIAWLIQRRLTKHDKPSLLDQQSIMAAGLICYGLMIVFNTYLTSLPIIRYDWSKVLGLKIISWPIEDLAYLVVALYVSPAVYAFWLKRYESKKTPPRIKSTSKSR